MNTLNREINLELTLEVEGEADLMELIRYIRSAINKYKHHTKSSRERHYGGKIVAVSIGTTNMRPIIKDLKID